LSPENEEREKEDDDELNTSPEAKEEVIEPE